jgi:hypothetical protein
MEGNKVTTKTFDDMSASTPLDWNTVTADLQRSVNNCALCILQSMTPPVWMSTFLSQVDVTQPPPGYEAHSPTSSDGDKPPAKRRLLNNPEVGPAKKKKLPAAASYPAL